MITLGDCVEVMAAMPESSVDAIVCDPPYGLEFMGKEWDRLATVEPATDSPGWRAGHGGLGAPSKNNGTPFGGGGNRVRYGKGNAQEWHHAWATEALRVAKPGAYLLAFGGTRTYHRLAVAIEDAGWIIRDCLVWAYASGFPKSKALLKPAWEPIVMARKPGPLRELAIDACRIGTTVETWPSSRGPNTGRSMAGGVMAERETGEVPAGRWPANVVLTDAIFDGDTEGVVGGGESESGISVRRNGVDVSDAVTFGVGAYPVGSPDAGYTDTGTYSRFFLVPKSSRSDREPTDPSFAYRLHRERGECVKLGAWDDQDQSLSEMMNSTSPERAISEATTTDGLPSNTSPFGSQPTDLSLRATKSTTSTATSKTTASTTSSSLTPLPTNGFTPAANSGTANGGSPAESAASSNLWGSEIGTSPVKVGRSMGDADPATSRSWSGKSNCGVCGRKLPRVSTHPTQKPTALMRHLVRLVTPIGGTVLDPFLGSGTTAIAAEMEGFAWLGIERDAEYVAIAEARLMGVQKGLGLDV